MAKGVKPIPEGLHTVTPHLVVNGGAEAIEFYKKAFGAEVIDQHSGPDGKSVIHAQIKIGNSALFLADEFPGTLMKSPRSAGTTTVNLNIYAEDADAVFDRAVKAGAKVAMPLADMFWGDRYGQVTDPFGHLWSIATHKEDVTPEEMEKRAAAFFASQPKK
jgi:uncharacterized glyoxalase superfamily protein PhnB